MTVKSIRVYRINKEAKLPTRAYSTDAGMDLYSIENKFIPKGETVVVKTGVAIEVPEGMVGKVEDRSSMALKGLRTGAGVVDSGYTGEVSVVLHNLTSIADWDDDLHERGYKIRKGDKIGQLLLYPIQSPEIVETNELWSSSRGSGGFGSSGR